jgi:integrase
MGSIFKPTYTDRHGQTRKTACWYARYTDATGRQRRVKGFTDKALTLQLLAKLEREATASRHGIDVPTADGLARPLSELLAEYESLQSARGLSTGHRRNCSAYIPEVIAACGWRVFADVSADRLIRWCDERRNASACSPATINGYTSAVRAFAKWAAGKLRVSDPLAGRVPKLNEEVDRRRSRRIPTPAELESLCRSAASALRRRGRITGADRSHLYRTAAYTGLRASELASLTPESFTRDPGTGRVVAVTVQAADAKGKREDTLPVPSHLAEHLGPWLATIPAGRRLWPGDWAANRGQWDWLDRDCKRAKIDPFPFHGLRAYFITHVIRAGANVAELQALARHRSATTSLKHYSRVQTDQLKRLADALPPPTADG